MKKRLAALLTAGILAGNLTAPAYAAGPGGGTVSADQDSASVASGTEGKPADTDATTDDRKAEIEDTLNLANNTVYTWTYDSGSGAWVMSVVPAVLDPEIADEQGVSVAVPAAYVRGIDADGDGEADVTAASYTESLNGRLVMDSGASVTSENGQVYTASTAPVVITTGAAGYSEQTNQTASTQYASDGYISIACGNRGKQSTAVNEDGETYYTGDAPLCLVDQKNAIRFVKYNILLGNLPGSVDYFVSTGGSGGGAHAVMVAATSDNSDFYDYEIEAGAAGVYRNEDGSYSTSVTIDGTEYEISDGVWGCIAYSAITSLAEADMDMAFEYNLDADYSFSTSFQKQLASYLSTEYMEYINGQGLTADEAETGFDLNGDGDTDDTVELTIEYNEAQYPDTNGYGGTYLTLYLDEFVSNLQWYVDNLSYAEGWTWFDEDGSALSDEEVAAMTAEDKAQAFIEGRYAKGESGTGGMPGGGMTGDGGNGFPDGDMSGAEGMPGNDGEGFPGGMTGNDGDGFPGGDMSGAEGMPGNGNGGDGTFPGGGRGSIEGDGENGNGGFQLHGGKDRNEADGDSGSEAPAEDGGTEDSGNTTIVGTPDAGTTQSASGGQDSANYSSFAEMLEAYQSDISEIEAGDKYGKNLVDLYNPLNYIGDEDTEAPAWTRIVMGAAEGDMSMFASLNLEIAWLNAGTDAEIEWQWDGGHVPSEIFGESLSLTIDTKYGEYVEGAAEIAKPEAETQTENGTAEEATGTDLSGWVTCEDGTVSFSLADAAAYRTAGASKAIPGFDVMDYGQETYEFGSSDQDARHFDKYVLQVLEAYEDELAPLFNAG